jgi:localization factor PodJL
MSLSSPWSVKGVQPKTREAAKDLARREGLTLGEWLNRLIGDVEEEGSIDTPREAPQSYPTPTPQHGQNRITQPQGHIQAQAQAQAQSFQQPSREEQPLAPFPNTARDTHSDSENSRLTAALEQLTRRLEASMGQAMPQPASQATGYVPQAVPPAPTPSYNPEPVPFGAAGLMDRLEATERRAETALGRVDASLADVRQTQAALAERLRVMEANDPANKSLQALRGLENALNRLSEQVFETQSRTQELGNNVNHIAQRLDSTEAVAGETRGRLAEAMVDLSARLTGVEQNQDDTRLQTQVAGLSERMAGMEDLTTQAIESVDKGLGLVSERVAATEALAQATNERLVEALIDLSARLVQLENIDSQEQAREVLSAIEAKNKELNRRLEVLDNKIDATRDELTQEVKTAVASGVDGRMAEIAKALADRLDMSERRSGEALERIGAEMARASISLDQRLRDIEDRGSDDIAAAMRNEMAKMARSIDERMAAMEQRDAEAMSQAGGHMKELAQSLNDRLDASEARAQTAVQNVSSQMEQLALRLQARQDETAKNLVARMEDGEARAHQDLKSSIEQLATEVRASEDRAKAVVAPLHRDFNAMIDRLDQVEARGMAPYAETISFGEQAIPIDADDGSNFDNFAGSAATPDYGTSLGDSFTPLSDQAPSAATTRRPGFGSPFPGTAAAETPADDAEFGAFDPNSELEAAFAGDTKFDEFDERNLLNDGASIQSSFDDEGAFVSDLDSSWDEAARPNRGGADYLANARLAASRAAAENAQAQPAKKAKPLLGGAKKKQQKSAVASGATDASGQTAKAKPVLSPVGVVAAAALVVTTGMIGINYLSKDKNPAQDEKPNALKVTPPAAVGEAATPAPTEGSQPPSAVTTDVAAPEAAPAPLPAPVPAPTAAPTPAATGAAGPAAATPRAVPRPSAQVRQFQAAENNRATEALARAEAAKARLRPLPVPAPSPQTAPTRVMASLTPTPTPVPVPAPIANRAPTLVPVAPSATAPRPVAPTARAPTARAATPQIASVTPGQRPPAFGTPVAAQRPAAPAPRAQASRTLVPRIAAANPTGPVTAANVRQVFDQAIAKQQAGDLAGAAALMRAAADTGDARSIQRLAKMYERGEGVPRDPAQARALTERAAQRGNSQAMHNLGVYYAEGESRDLAKAAENFRRAASRGVTDSQFNLGAMAEQGMGGPRSEREAYYWYSVAGRNGDRDAASKARELGARLPAAERTAEDQRAAQFRPEPSPGD